MGLIRMIVAFISLQLHQLPGTSSSAATGHDLALARQFFEANRASPAIFASAIPELSNPQMKDAWIAEQQQHMRIFESNKSHSQWTAEFDGGAIPRQISLPQQPQTMTSDREFCICSVLSCYMVLVQ